MRRPTRSTLLGLCLVLAVTSGSSAQPADPLLRAQRLEAEASRYRQQGQFAAGLSKAREALELREQGLGPNHPDVARSLGDVGDFLRLVGDHPGARAALERALRIQETAYGTDDRRVAASLGALGPILRITGDYEGSRQVFERALRIYERVERPDSVLVVGTLERLAWTLTESGDYAAARPLLERALLFHEARDPNSLATADRLAMLATVLNNLGDRTGARTLAERALRIAEAVGPRNPPVGRALDVLANILEASGDYVGARPLRERSLDITTRAYGPQFPWVAESYNNFADLLRILGDNSLARPHYEQAIRIARTIGAPEPRWRAALGLGRVHEAQGALAEALALYREAVSTLESLSGQFTGEARRARYLEARSRLGAYDALAQLLLKLHQQDPGKGYDHEAVAVLEAKKGRLAADALVAARPTPRSPQARGEAEQVRAKQDYARGLEKELLEEQAKPPTPQRADTIRTLTTVLARTKAEYLTERETFLTRYPQYKAQFVDQQTIDPRMLAKFADRLPADTLVVEYFAAPDALYVFLVAAGRQLQVKQQAISQADLYALVGQFRRHVQAGERQALPWSDDGSGAYRREVASLKVVSRALAAHLLEPIESELAAHRSLILVPNDLLLYLPIHALERRQPDGSLRFLAETHAVSYATQLELIDLLNPSLPRGSAPLLALANPDGSLPGASQEVRALRQVRPRATVFEGAQATKAQLLAPGFSDLHFATHGVLDLQRPERSYLLMAGPDDKTKRLTIGEIASLHLPDGLAILSACDTALGEEVPGAALVTLAAAFSQAGAQSVVASLWKAEDGAARDFMVAFHGGLMTAGRAAALQKAQRTLIADPQTAHPFYWAPFILIGAR